MTASIDITLPEDQLEGTSATLLAWLVKPGDRVTQNQPVAELETDKVTMEVAAPCDGIVSTQQVKEGDEIIPGMVVGSISAGDSHCEANDAPPPQAPAIEPSRRQNNANRSNGSEQLLSPAVRRLMRDHQIDLSGIEGSGKAGRITKSDLLAHIADSRPKAQLIQAPQVEPRPAIKPSEAEPARHAPESHSPSASTLRPHNTMRKQIASHMVESLLHTAPHVTSVFELDMSAIQRHRSANKKAFEAQGVKLSFTTYFIAAVVKALQAVPEVNSRFHDDALEMFHDANIGIGTALGNDGLVVPVIHKAQDLNLLGIARRLQELTDAAHNGKLKPADMRGGTFTISNHGVSGSLLAAPIIINQPQVAILGIGKMQKRVVVEEINGVDAMVIRPMCYLTLSIDHRALDGYQTNTFLSIVVDTLQNWS
ncbi:Dihydrolipoamide acyltransferase component of branched-chain alpha-keto acid dehydrogenase complex [Marinobacterium lacunae]|uniref:Dihydrolipoamide acetyltransferase component of pyruvate dehydrogenase complex n=1 Tax=Marinobacterium lacunae TaxID=1232683 RepID=A0A081FXS2_9GAMM|nr:2-oxo acid dehydrogenase subunit E2 [Marinobacterium lacunae]KEA63327.1 Dihydrolipoamide acyltransferase component of branched-chain alpha-keto acid dehydrogenase complex [Marinobacterium lacunae]